MKQLLHWDLVTIGDFFSSVASLSTLRGADEWRKWVSNTNRRRNLLINIKGGCFPVSYSLCVFVLCCCTWHHTAPPYSPDPSTTHSDDYCRERQHYLQNNRNDFMLIAMLPQLLRDIMLANWVFKGEVKVITAKLINCKCNQNAMEKICNNGKKKRIKFSCLGK